MLKDNELICPHTGLHESWLLSIVPLRIKEDTHWQIKDYAFIKNVTAILGVLHLAKDMFGITQDSKHVLCVQLLTLTSECLKQFWLG